jgi:hypothetical protein
MVNTQIAFIHFFRNWKRITSLNINKHLQKGIFKSYFNNFVFSNPNSMSRQMRITGFQVSYCDLPVYDSFWNLINHVYYFTAKRSIHHGGPLLVYPSSFKLHYPDAKMIAFEPDDAGFSCLQKNVRITIYKMLTWKDGVIEQEWRWKVLFDRTTPESSCEHEPGSDSEMNVKSGNRTIKLYKWGSGFPQMDIESAEEVVIAELSKRRSCIL